jgi:4-aminobutyrate aminotransferase-like enzyme
MDWSSGVLVTNAGHGNPEVVKAIVKQAQKPMLHNYCFPSEARAELAKRLVEVTPPKMAKAFILTTGAETTECAIKLSRTYGLKVGGRKKIGMISFRDAFHGRTMGSQQIGGSPALKDWIVNLDPSMWQVTFPDEYLAKDTSFDGFLAELKKLGVTPDIVAGVITETYQGGRASFAPKAYIQELARWCKDHDIVLAMDEVQAGFGRTGKKFGFEHYGVVPDLMCCGKGITSSLPLSAILGRLDLMDQYVPGSMTSTHTGSPVCAAAALANINYIWKHRLWENAARMGEVMLAELRKLEAEFAGRVGHVYGKGLVAAAHIVGRDGRTPDYDLAFEAVRRCMEKGLLMFSPVGASSIKIAPPLTINKAQVLEGCAVLREAIGEAIAAAH